MTVWTSYKDREDWLAHRWGIGASEAGSACGVGFKSRLELWREKTGMVQPEDISGDSRVQFGNDVEEPLRALYRVMHPEHLLEFTPYTILRRDDDEEHAFMFSTPDGWLTEKATGRIGLYESKSATLLSAADYAKWRNRVPDGYYHQIMHSMYVGGFDFAVIFAILLNKEGDAEVRAYPFERTEVERDMMRMVEQETEFWRCVESQTMPSTKIRF